MINDFRHETEKIRVYLPRDNSIARELSCNSEQFINLLRQTTHKSLPRLPFLALPTLFLVSFYSLSPHSPLAWPSDTRSLRFTGGVESSGRVDRERYERGMEEGEEVDRVYQLRHIKNLITWLARSGGW